MAAQPTQQTNRDFKGLGTNIAAHDKPPGVSQVQINLTQTVRGQTKTRDGMRQVVWEN